MKTKYVTRFTEAIFWGVAMVLFLVAFSIYVGDSVELITALAAGALFSIPLRHWIKNMDALLDPNAERITCPVCDEPRSDVSRQLAPDQMFCSTDGCPVSTWNPKEQ